MSLHSEPVLRRSERRRALTNPAEEEYERKVERFHSKLCDIKADIRDCWNKIEESQSDVKTLDSLDKLLTEAYQAYQTESDKLCEYLKRMRTRDSEIEMSAHMLVRDTVMAKITVARNRISRLIKIEEPTGRSVQYSYKSLSQESLSSSNKTSIESVIRRKEAKLEAQHARMEHLEEELELEAKLKRLRARRDIKATTREISVLKEEPPSPELASIKSGKTKTEEYLFNLPRYEAERRTYELLEEERKAPAPRPEPEVKFQEKQWAHPQQSFAYMHEPMVSKAQLNPGALDFVPREAPQPQQSQVIDVFTKHLVKRDLILSRLSKFNDDDPMMYVSWKLGFQGIMTELGASDTEVLELLCEKLGTNSSKQAKTIKACNANNPAAAIAKIWERLDRRFGAAEQVEKYIHKKICDFPEVTTDKYHLLYDLVDLATEIASVKSQPQFEILFSYFDSKKGVNELVDKLPWNLKEKWTTEATRYKRNAAVVYPPFSVFLKFLEDMAEMKNDPAFQFEKSSKQRRVFHQQRTPGQPHESKSRAPITTITARKTEAITQLEVCPLHKNSTHLLNDCMQFRQKPISERKNIILTNGICFKCCSGKKHRAKNCKADVKCSVCGTTSHPTALHGNVKLGSDTRRALSDNGSLEAHEGEGKVDRQVSTACTKVCGVSKSCAKIVPVRVHHTDSPDKTMLVYATIDDQSNRSLATSAFFDYFGVNDGDVPYTLVSCGGSVLATGRVGAGYVVESLHGDCQLSLPELIECNDLPSNREEIPSRQIAMHYPHLVQVASEMSPIIETASINLLIGRDVLNAHVVQEQIVGDEDQPFAQKLPLGWVVVGPVCLGGAHVSEVRTFKTFIMKNGRPSNFQPCDSEMAVHSGLFHKTEHDEKIGLSVEDKEFLQMMDTSFEKDNEGHWVAPLPFKKKRLPLPNNKSQAVRRAKSFDTNLRHHRTKYEHVKEFMQKLFDRGHAEIAPVLGDNTEQWYLPMFAVYHPRKPGSVRVVFDSSARHEGISLNDSLMKGPDLSNSLQGVLMRFRLERIAVMADVEQMFHNFRVRNDHRDYLRFFWHKDHDLQSPLVQYRMTVHVFGNSPSPSVATYGLRRAVSSADSDVQDFVSRNFYVDDGLMSFNNPSQAVDLITRTQQALFDGGRLRLHKIASNSVEVLQQFSKDDLAKDLAGLDIGNDTLPDQRSLGISWSIASDTFTFKVNSDSKPFSRRGVLSVINSLFDPIGFTAPVTIEGKVLLRDAMSTKCDWDEPLPESFQWAWLKWVDSLHSLEGLQIPRMYCQLSFEGASRIEVHIFSDASKEAVAAVAYIKVFHEDHSELGFLMGKAKVAPSHGHTIPRLELCGCVLAVDIAEIIRDQLHFSNDVFTFHTDSQVVLGYISNDSKRFHVYVANRVSRIRSFCEPDAWRYVASEQNPADVGTRGCSARGLPSSNWLVGPSFLIDKGESSDRPLSFDLVDPDSDVEVRKQVTCSKTAVNTHKSGSEDSLHCEKISTWTQRFERFSSWSSLVRALVCLRKFLSRKSPEKQTSVSLKEDVEHFVIKESQRARYSSEIQAIQSGSNPPRNSSLISLNPILDQNGFLRVGGRVKHMKDSYLTSHPIIIPKDHHIAVLLVQHFHAKIHHQGRHMTEGAIREAGFWIVGARRLVNATIRSCITCKKLRGCLGWSQMADLPSDRIEPGPPFTFVGVDAFGPWPVVVRKTTRSIRTTSKYWAILFTCLVSRAVHIELVEDMSSDSFINALRRFTSIRGPVRQFRSDRGTNFIGAIKELGINASFDENGPVHEHLVKSGSTWIFNPPYAHHFGGAWERLIGSCRRILDALLLENKPKDLTREVLATFMAEVCAIMNARPLLPVSTDPETPSVLSPSMILTQKLPESCVSMTITGFGPKDAMRSQWKLVQRLADEFWRMWRQEYVHCLQTRKKWQLPGTPFSKGDLVLVKDDSVHRNLWPVGLIEEVYPSKDGVVRKTKVSIIRDNARVSYVRPISELVHLLNCE